MSMIICDIDGTIANVEHRVHFVEGVADPDWAKFFDAMVDDTPNAWCVELLKALHDAGHLIYFVSGRPDNYRAHTERWLADTGITFYSALLMRPAGDHSPDTEIKQNIYENYLKYLKDDILFVIDDRKSVVDMWRSNGLTVLQCDVGEF